MVCNTYRCCCNCHDRASRAEALGGAGISRSCCACGCNDGSGLRLHVNNANTQFLTVFSIISYRDCISGSWHCGSRRRCARDYRGSRRGDIINGCADDCDSVLRLSHPYVGATSTFRRVTTSGDNRTLDWCEPSNSFDGSSTATTNRYGDSSAIVSFRGRIRLGGSACDKVG
jgi:hypothetical protein